jgi:hypothetical protein
VRDLWVTAWAMTRRYRNRGLSADFFSFRTFLFIHEFVVYLTTFSVTKNI